MTGRSLLLTRVIRASPARVWRCWTDPQLLPRWFGPEGFSCLTKEIDLRPGGRWLFDMIGPDGKVWPNLHLYDRYDPERAIDYRLYDPSADALHAEVAVRLRPAGGGCRLTMEMTFPSPESRDSVVDFGAVELGQTTLAKLAQLAET